jgi:uncharacterized protein YbjQ (UPF0145 family)
MIQIALPLFLMCIGYIWGSRVEKKHYISIREREDEFCSLPAVSFKKIPESFGSPTEATLVTGSTVVAIDYFKKIFSAIKNITGGRLTSYESLIDRARREAILRMKAQAMSMGADLVMNIRIETSCIGKGGKSRRSTSSIEVLAYGTAVKFQ